MDHEIFKSVPQGSDGAQEAENRRIKEIADELSRLCGIYETQSGTGKTNVNSFETEQRIAEQMAKSQGFWIPMMDTYMAALGFEKGYEEGRFSNGDYEAWDLLPRNVLVDSEGDIFVVDAEIKQI